MQFASFVGHNEIMRQEIVSTPGILGGKPCISGTRISVQLILQMFANRATREEILTDYPDLTEEGVNAALAFAARSLENDAFVDLKILG